MVKLRMGADRMIEASDVSVPEIRSQHGAPHIQRVVCRPAVDEDHLAIGQFNHGGVALADIQKRHAQGVPVRTPTGRPTPPSENQQSGDHTAPSQRGVPLGSAGNIEQREESEHGGNGRRRHVPFGPRDTRHQRHHAGQKVQDDLIEWAGRKRVPSRQQQPDGGPQSHRDEEQPRQRHHEQVGQEAEPRDLVEVIGDEWNSGQRHAPGDPHVFTEPGQCLPAWRIRGRDPRRSLAGSPAEHQCDGEHGEVGELKGNLK